MRVRARLAWMVALLTLLPAIPAVLITRSVVRQTVELSANEELGVALEAGVRRARALLEEESRSLQVVAEEWGRVLRDAESPEDTGLDRLVRPDREVRPDRAGQPDREVRPDRAGQPDRVLRPDRVVLVGSDGQQHVLAAGAPALERSEAPALVLGEGGFDERESLARVPWRTEFSLLLDDGSKLEASRLLDPEWRRDAARLERGLQMVRALGVERSTLALGFWFPFLLIYAVALGVGLLAALTLGNRLTGSVKRLVHATDRVAAGDWAVRVPGSGDDEIGVLGDRFNAMVSTLDAQSRRLIDLETMAGWREMARALAHEVKNPLTPIQLTVEEIQQRYKGDDAKYQALLDECTGIVVEEVESLRRVVERFREFSRPVELRPRALDLNELLGGVGALQRGLSMEFALDKNVGEVVADQDRLRQVLLNLLENAREVLEERATARVRVSSHSVGEDDVEILVEDDGPGIPEGERDRVFEPYRTGRSGGLGLGLSLVKGIVLAHSGSIEVGKSDLGGAAFRIVLPRTGPLEVEV